MAPNIKQSLSLFTSPSNASRRNIKKRHTNDENRDDTIDTLPGDPVKTRLWSATTVGTIGRNGPPIIKPDNNFLTNAAGAIGPTALLVGGTAAMYNSLLNHPSSTLTPVSILYMLLLAIQTSVQPRLSRRYIPKKVSKVKVALVEEVIKTSVASVLFWKWSSQNVIREALKDWTLSSSLLVAGIPATLYAVQGVLTYLSHQHLDSVTFNGLSQTKTLTAALCCHLVMGKRQSPLQIVALALLFASAFVFQNMAIGFRWARGGQEETTAMARTMKKVVEDDTVSSDDVDSSDGDSRSSQETATTNPQPALSLQAQMDLSSLQASTQRQADQSFLLYGVLPCLGATFLSGLAGAFSQRGLQIVGGSGRNAFLYTVEVSFFSAVALLVSEGISMLKRNAAPTTEGSNSTVSKQAGLDDSTEASTAWPWQTYIPIACKAMGGILTALVHKHAGSVVKGFALMLGLVMSGILQSLWLDTNANTNAPNTAHSRLPMHQVLGIVIVMFSSWLHFTNPPP